jgi:peptidoglycan/xylan/chitin deacetylase (PgdA/CDA1 family)
METPRALVESGILPQMDGHRNVPGHWCHATSLSLLYVGIACCGAARLACRLAVALADLALGRPKSLALTGGDIEAGMRDVTTRKGWEPGFVAGVVLLFAGHLPSAALAQDGTDWATRLPRDPVHVSAWPAGRKVAVSFTLFVEEFGFGQGPVFRPDLATRSPDLVNEAFRQYAIDWGIARVGRLFKELDVPLSVALNAEFPRTHMSVWKEFRAARPNAPIIAHGMNNTSQMLPLGRGLAEQKAYIRRTLDLIAGTTGVRPTGWSSPSVYSNGDTMQAMAAEGITYTLDQMDSDIISRLKTPDGSLVLLPYPVVTVDMGQHLARMKTPTEIETLWLDYVLELASEARAEPAREATTVVIGIHPFVIGTPDGAAALRRVLSRLKKDDDVWLTDTDAILMAAGLK